MEALKRCSFRALLVAAAATVALTACWDRAYGPVIRNDYDHTVRVRVEFVGAPPSELELAPHQMAAQRENHLRLEKLSVNALSGEQLISLGPKDIEALGLSPGHDLVSLSPGGARALSWPD